MLEQFSNRREAETPTPPKPKPQPIAVVPSGLPIAEIVAKLSELQQQYPDAEFRRGRANRWELWRSGGGRMTGDGPSPGRQLIPLHDCPHRLDVDPVGPRELFLERAVTVSLDEFRPLSVRQADLLLVAHWTADSGRTPADLRLPSVEHPLQRG